MHESDVYKSKKLKESINTKGIKVYRPINFSARQVHANGPMRAMSQQ